MEFTYTPKGVCSVKIKIDYNNEIINQVKFIGGCAGNTQGVAKLCEGRKIDDVIKLLEGIQCRNGTSCPDQLAKALIKLKQN